MGTCGRDRLAVDVRTHGRYSRAGPCRSRRFVLDRCRIAIGKQPAEIMNIFRKSAGESPASLESVTLQQGEALAWLRDSGKPPFVFQSSLPRAERRRHRRKYAEGELRPDLCFYFRGPEGKLNLKAQNLAIFLQIADGLDVLIRLILVPSAPRMPVRHGHMPRGPRAMKRHGPNHLPAKLAARTPVHAESC